MSGPVEPLFAVACPACRGTVAVERGLVGAAARCPLCPASFLVPDPGPAAAPAGHTRASASAVDQAAPTRNDAETPANRGAPAHALAATGPGTAALADERPVRAASAAQPRPLTDEAAGPPGRRRLSPDQRSRRRSRRTLVIMVGGIAILLVLAATLGRRPRRARR